MLLTSVDITALVGYIRDNGAMNAVISTEVNNIESLKKKLLQIPQMVSFSKWSGQAG